MPFSSLSPGCPCCEENCELVADDFSVDSQLWTLVGGNEADWSIVAGELQMSAALELLHDTTHPGSLGSVKISVSMWSAAAGQPEIILASDFDGSTALVVRFFGFGESCGELRVYHRVAGVETLISQQHVIAPLPAETWIDVVICWHAVDQSLTISAGATVTEYPPASVSGAYFGLGNAGSDSVAFDDLAVEKVADGEDSDATDCPLCSPSCTLASEPSPGMYPCVSTRTGTWTQVDFNYEGAAGSTYFHKTRITATRYVVRAVWDDFGYDESTLTADKIRVYYTSSLYAEFTVTKPSPFSTTYRLTVNINGSASVTHTINFAEGNLRVNVCVRPGQVSAVAELWKSGGLLGDNKIRTAAAYTQGTGPFDCGVSSVTNTNKLSLFGVFRYVTDDLSCYECAQPCPGCLTLLPDLLSIDLGAIGTLINNLVDSCVDAKGKWIVEASTDKCVWRGLYVIGQTGCEHATCQESQFQNVTLSFFLRAQQISTTPPTYGWTLAVRIQTLGVMLNPAICWPYCPALGKYNAGTYYAEFPEDCAALPVTLNYTGDGGNANKLCDGEFPDTVVLDVA